MAIKKSAVKTAGYYELLYRKSNSPSKSTVIPLFLNLAQGSKIADALSLNMGYGMKHHVNYL